MNLRIKVLFLCNSIERILASVNSGCFDVLNVDAFVNVCSICDLMCCDTK